MAYLTLQTFTTGCCGEYVLGFRVHMMSRHAHKPNRRTSKITPHSITSIMTTALFDALLLASHVNIDVPKRTRREDSKERSRSRNAHRWSFLEHVPPHVFCLHFSLTVDSLSRNTHLNADDSNAGSMSQSLLGSFPAATAAPLPLASPPPYRQ